LDGGVLHGDGNFLPASASRSSRNISFPSCHRLARFKGRRISFRIAHTMSCLGERTARTQANYSRIRSVRLASRRNRPQIPPIAPSFSSLAATESSSCSRSDAGFPMPFTLDARVARPAPRITSAHRQTAETAKAASAQFHRVRRAAGARPLLSLFGR
jgi:hypothetical protein